MRSYETTFILAPTLEADGLAGEISADHFPLARDESDFRRVPATVREGQLYL